MTTVGPGKEQPENPAPDIPAMCQEIYKDYREFRENDAHQFGLIDKKVFPALGESGPTTDTQTAISILICCLRHGDNTHRDRAASALGALCQTLSTDERETLIVELQAMLGDSDLDVRYAAVAAVGKIGKAAARTTVLQILLNWIKYDEHPDGSTRARQALREMGAVVARQEIIQTLLEWLHDSDANIRRRAAEVLGDIGAPAAVHPEVVPALCAQLHYDSSHDINHLVFLQVQAYVAQTLGKMGVPIATNTVVEALIHCLKSGSIAVRSAAAQALGQMREVAAAHPGVFQALIDVVANDSITDSRCTAATALSESGAANSLDKSNTLFDFMIPWLDCGNEHLVLRTAAVVLGKLKTATAEFEVVVSKLIPLVNHNDPLISQAALEALGEMGAVTRKDVLRNLLACMDPHAKQRSVAASVLERNRTRERHTLLRQGQRACLRDAD